MSGRGARDGAPPDATPPRGHSSTYASVSPRTRSGPARYPPDPVLARTIRRDSGLPTRRQGRLSRVHRQPVAVISRMTPKYAMVSRNPPAKSTPARHPKRRSSRRIQSPPRLTIGLRRVPFDRALESCELRDRPSDVPNWEISVPVPRFTGSAHVVAGSSATTRRRRSRDVQELARRWAGAPAGNGVGRRSAPRRTCGSAPGSRASLPGRSCRRGRKDSPAAGR